MANQNAASGPATLRWSRRSSNKGSIMGEVLFDAFVEIDGVDHSDHVTSVYVADEHRRRSTPRRWAIRRAVKEPGSARLLASTSALMTIFRRAALTRSSGRCGTAGRSSR